MEDKRHPDQLESLFKKTFEQLGDFPAESPWNVPSEEVWESVQARTKKQSSSRIRPIWWVTAAVTIGLILMVGIAQHQHYQQQLSALSNQLESNERKVQEMQAQMEHFATNEPTEVQNDRTADSENPQKQALDFGQLTSPNLAATTSSSTKQSIRKTTSADLSPSLTNPPVITNLDYQNGSELGPFNDKIVTIQPNQPNSKNAHLSNVPTSITSPDKTIHETKNLSAFEGIPIAALDMPNVNSPSRFEEAQALVPRVDLEPPLQREGYVGGVFSPLKSLWPDLNNVDTPFPKPQENVHAHTMGIQVGLAARRNWVIETGLQYTASRMEAQHTRGVPYSSINERMNAQGLYESSYDVIVSTSSGAVETDVSLARNPSTAIEDGESIDLALNLAFETKYLEVPVISKYQVHFGPVAISARAGIVSRYLVDQQLSVNNVETQTTGFTHQKTDLQSRGGFLNEKDRLSFHYLLGFGVDYRFHPNWSLSLEPTYQRGVSPILAFGTHRVYQETLGINLGVRYWL
ncbi:MAG: hypothetical protein AAGD05_06890 [Bacteroidota bacterium]